MPFRSLNIDTGETLKIEQYAHPKVDLQGIQLGCPFCKHEMFIRGGIGKHVTAHFVHKSICQAHIAHGKGNGESPEHRVAKQYFLNELQQVNKQHVQGGELTYDMEVTLKRDDVWRIIDIAEIDNNGRIVRAFEIQLSGISLDNLKERTQDYESFGIDVVWIFGKTANTSENREWCLQNIGFCGIVKIEHRVVTTQDILEAS